MIVEAQEVSLHVQAQVKPLFLSLSANSPLTKARNIIEHAGKGQGKASHLCHGGRSLPSNMAEGVDTGRTWDQMIHSTTRAYSVPGTGDTEKKNLCPCRPYILC